jgi:hypothetical protein
MSNYVFVGMFGLVAIVGAMLAVLVLISYRLVRDIEAVLRRAQAREKNRFLQECGIAREEE